MEQVQLKKFLTILWVSFMVTIIAFAYILSVSTGGLELLGDLDYNRMVRLDDPMALNFYIISALIFAAHRHAPRLVRGPNQVLLSFMVKMVMLESIAMFGFLLGNMSKDLQMAIPFFILSFLGMLLASPLLGLDKPERGTPIT